jgi:tRNA(fMet)-specific endonuclease VapC
MRRQWYLPDTVILSAYFRRERPILRRLSEVDYVLSSVVAGELFEWCLWPTRQPERLDWLRDLNRIVPALDVDFVTGERFGLLSGLMKQRGTVKGDNDLWIAAQALQYDLIVATRDSDFSNIPGLKVEYW